MEGLLVEELLDDESDGLLLEEVLFEAVPLEDVPESDDPEPLEEAPESDDPELFAPDMFFFCPVLKSVSYQPPPFSRNPGADTSLLSFVSSHAGQTFSGTSEIF